MSFLLPSPTSQVSKPFQVVVSPHQVLPLHLMACDGSSGPNQGRQEQSSLRTPPYSHDLFGQIFLVADLLVVVYLTSAVHQGLTVLPFPREKESHLGSPGRGRLLSLGLWCAVHDVLVVLGCAGGVSSLWLCGHCLQEVQNLIPLRH